MTSQNPITLDNISVASPCPANWSEMTGDEQVRFCGQCQLNVYNLSGMSRNAAEQLIQEKEGKLCVRYFQRADGTIITQECPVGLRAKYQRRLLKTGLGTAAAAILLITAVGVFTSIAQAEGVKGKIAPRDNSQTHPPVVTGGMVSTPRQPDPAPVEPPTEIQGEASAPNHPTTPPVIKKETPVQRNMKMGKLKFEPSNKK